MRRHRLMIAVLVLIAASSSRAQPARPSADLAERRATFLEMFARAYYPGRSGQIMIVPDEGEVILEPDDPLYRFMHGSPWSYDVDIPLLAFGPTFIRSGTWDDPVVQQDIAPTLAALLRLSAPATTSGRPLTSILRDTAAPPRAILLGVLDGMRVDYFDTYAADLPTLTRLRRDGAWFARARVNYLPSLTSVGHATIATGADPQVHGVAANTMYNRTTGRPEGPYPGLSPANLMALTIADLLNLDSDGQAVIIAQGTTPRATIALGGHGRCLVNGGAIVLAMFDGTDGRWTSNPNCYRLPDYLRDANAQTAWEAAGGQWLGHEVSSGRALLRTGLFPRFQVDALMEMIEREGVGDDEVPDLILVNFKTPDYVAHQYGPASDEQRAALHELDRELGRVLESLDRHVGRARYVAVFTGDHGMPADPEADGHRRHYVTDIVEALHDRFDPEERRVVLFYGDPADNQLFIDTPRLRVLGWALTEVADYMASLPFIFAAFSEDEVAAAVRR